MGETFVQPICMDIQGKKALIAVFGVSDIIPCVISFPVDQCLAGPRRQDHGRVRPPLQDLRRVL